jgi:hypothetical protein
MRDYDTLKLAFYSVAFCGALGASAVQIAPILDDPEGTTAALIG